MTSEFELISRHFTRATRHTDLPIGDDAALLSPGQGMQLAISTDMLVSGTHFLPDADPEALGWKTLAVNVSDIAAMGALPRWALLALSLPAADEDWVAAFATGLFACADAHDIDIAGGDTTAGPLNLCVTIIGEVPVGTAITRAGAKVDDEIWVTGQPGRAALGLAHLLGEISLREEPARTCLEALHRPRPRLAAGLALRGIATAMLDVSDGLLGDLRHILEQSQVGAEVDTAALPLDALLACGAPPEHAYRACLGGGDDYELLFTAPPQDHTRIAALSRELDLTITRIGRITSQAGETVLLAPDGSRSTPTTFGYDHFG